ncbi:hypothetical protein E4P43_14445 [Blastococcus sp. TF02A-35]|nr:hypothetical protein E4P43_14445 [Blastococcus sp. TF02A_35]
MVALCLGTACAVARARTVGAVGEAVRSTRGAVLVTAGCLGPCGLAAVAAVAHRRGEDGCSGPTVWLSGVQDAERAAALAAWVREGGPGPSGEPDAGLPATLVPAEATIGPPMRIGPAGG